MNKNADKIALVSAACGIAGVTLAHYAEVWILGYPLVIILALVTAMVFQD